MRDWCNQNLDKCPNCYDRGYIIVRNDDPLSPYDFIPKFCYCDAGKRLTEEPIPLPKMNWDTIWMNLAKSVGTRSTCLIPNRQVGCVIVSDDNTKVLAIGYNGSAKGDDNSCEYNGDHKKIGDRCWPI